MTDEFASSAPTMPHPSALAWVGSRVPASLRKYTSEGAVVVPFESGELAVRSLEIGTTADHAGVVELSETARAADNVLTPTTIASLLTEERAGLATVLPPFAAIVVTRARTLTAATDPIGARHLYLSRQASWSAVATSTAALGAAASASIDREAVAVQALLGWQLGTRTWFEGVEKLEAGCLIDLVAGGSSVDSYLDGSSPKPQSLDRAVVDAAAMLRTYMGAVLDSYPNATLQLTGGQDSRLLLSAIPAERRRGLRALTLDVPGSEDTRIAAELAERYGLDHQIASIDDGAEIDPATAFTQVTEASRRLDYMADPIALAALTRVESRLDGAPRISGLGGEVARGFYYLGSVPLVLPVTRLTVSWLAGWRMFANEAVAPAALDRELARWARPFATGEIERLLEMTGRGLFAASDEFYLFQRMQRWAGVTDTAVCFDRVVINPMLDNRFLDIARGLEVRDKIGSRFLSRLQVQLDEELADIPLDGRPPPRAFASRSFEGLAAQTTSLARRTTRKAHQRLGRSRKAPAGGEELSDLVVRHWRAHPALLEEAVTSGILDGEFIDKVVSGQVNPDPATVAFVVNAATACHDLNTS